MNKKIFTDFDFSDFWIDSNFSLEEYVEMHPTDDLISSIELELGYKLPASYIELMKLHNGGTPKNCRYRTNLPTSWSEDHIAITGIMGIGNEKPNSICGDYGSEFWIDEWGYPNIGIYICDCPSAGHDMVMLDYSKCGKKGEPEVVHIDQESDYKKTFLAKNFETFIRGLINESEFDTSEQDLIDELETFKSGQFSNVLQEYFKTEKKINFDKVLRNLFTELTTEKGYFALHSDSISYLAYDIQFYLLTINKKIKTKQEFIKCYPEMVAIGNNEISTKGYANFFEDWFDIKLKNEEIKKTLSGELVFTKDYQKELFEKIDKYK